MLFYLVLFNAAGFIKKIFALGGSYSQQAVNHSLAHDAVSAFGKFRSREQKMNINQPHQIVIYQILAFPCPIQSAGNNNFRKIQTSITTRVIQSHGHFGCGKRAFAF